MSIKNIGWSIGNFCNAMCNHCYSWKMRAGVNDILSREEIDLIINKLIEYEIETINFGGNEPIFTNGRDLEKTTLPYIIERFYNAEIKVGITTNGFTANYLYENYPVQFMMVNDWDFSLDSPCKEVHNANRRSSEAFDNVLRGLEICTKNNKPKSIVIAGMKGNLDRESLDGFLKIAYDNCTELRINFLKPTQKKHFEMMPTSEEVYETVDYLMKYLVPVTISEPTIAAHGKVECLGCPCGSYSFRIKNKRKGKVNVTPCVYMDFDAGDILTNSIEEIVNSKVFKDYVKRKNDIPNECRTLECEYIESCRGGCTARTLLVTNDINCADPYCLKKFSGDKYTKGQKYFIAEDGNIRVHDNYLCTFIGKFKENINFEAR